ncbi:AN1-type domain-containing protein [Caenorhabditis elegans]|uniref:AN1-type domain-containing protein n=2 Tax=Caenorhabditis elegans TaxID=6239 RepID=Q9XUW8_CAEEL|nr:AN1-type domain-containing protein [Caenorhabditis elegans]CAB04515.1 AN1-type domain-containing protein [Caenorhabditis elegans]|eukprot:NP_506479.1 Arsenite Inducible Protein [Caenorhabditis elegans]
MAEFPNLGKHCESTVCNRLDFLPIKCSGCGHFYCSEHFTFEAHNCPTGSRISVQVPICPICEKPVPTPKDVNVDQQVNEHIQNNCQTPKRAKVYSNACTVPKCKKKELVAMNCSKCRNNYCLSHRHERDHSCERKVGEMKINQKKSWTDSITSIARSRMNPCSAQARTEGDEALARSLQQEEYNRVAPPHQTRNSNSNCTVS